MSASPSAHRVALTIGLGKRPHHMALIEGLVRPRGIDLTCVYEFPEPFTVERHKRIARGELDGGEMSTSSFISSSSRAQGGSLIAIPVFPFRAFRHDSIFCHEKGGINAPSDLIGKKVAVHRYNASTMTWARGILRDEYGIRSQDVAWYTAGEEVFQVARPAGVSIEALPPPSNREQGIEMVARASLMRP